MKDKKYVINAKKNNVKIVGTGQYKGVCSQKDVNIMKGDLL